MNTAQQAEEAVVAVPAEPTPRRTPHERLLGAGARPVGGALEFADELHRLMSGTPLFAGLDIVEIRSLARLMFVYDAEPAQTLIVEGDGGDFMLLMMSGMVDVLRRNRYQYPSRISVALPGQTLGEMSLFDGEPRFASCVALERSRFAVLSREGMQRVLHDDPALGNKIMLRLVQLLSARLRQTSARLVSYIEASRES
jgi:CRP/FNR family cyclic AMP-dependent transcriptional regulator